jgi:hypothetical protein
LARLVQRALDEEVIVQENGRRRRISKREAALTQLLDKAAQSDPAPSVTSSVVLVRLHAVERVKRSWPRIWLNEHAELLWQSG